MMKRSYLLALAAFMVSAPSIAAEKDSVYTWGVWAEGIKPAAGPVAKVTPPPARQTDVNFRPNENAAYLREAIPPRQPNIVTGIGNIDTSRPVVTTPPAPVTPPPPAF
ncbi:hypothetical protein MNBD_GAMMA09-1794 [hydrothermal vent metagenome]|uniref:Uncharacterized protein n=1 Tax=hydrothermal vent metagenome TaxID=652676 RepID=A0A3B0XKW7_9ZZZZ